MNAPSATPVSNPSRHLVGFLLNLCVFGGAVVLARRGEPPLLWALPAAAALLALARLRSWRAERRPGPGA